MGVLALCVLLFFFNDTATTEIYTLSLHDALPISARNFYYTSRTCPTSDKWQNRSEEHTSELQSLTNLVCRLLLEKKTTDNATRPTGLAGQGAPIGLRHPRVSLALY